MRWSKPDEHLPGYWVPENEADAEDLELRRSQEDGEEDEEEETTEQDRIDAAGDDLYHSMREDGEL